MELERDESMLLLKRYNECLGLEDKPSCNNFGEDSNNNNRKVMDGQGPTIKQEIMDTPVSGGVHSQTDDDSMDESEGHNGDTNGDVSHENNNYTNVKMSPKAVPSLSHSSEPGIVRPIPTNPFSIPNQQMRTNFIPSLPSDHTGLLTFLDEEGKRRAALNAAQANFNNALQNFANGKDISANLNIKHELNGDKVYPKPSYPNSEFRRTSAPACLWSAVSMLNNPSVSASNMANINEAVLVSFVKHIFLPIAKPFLSSINYNDFLINFF